MEKVTYINKQIELFFGKRKNEKEITVQKCYFGGGNKGKGKKH